MAWIVVPNDGMDTDGGRPTGDPADQQCLPERAGYSPKPDTGKKQNSTGCESAAESSAIMSNQRDKTRIDQVKLEVRVVLALKRQALFLRRIAAQDRSASMTFFQIRDSRSPFLIVVLL